MNIPIAPIRLLLTGLALLALGQAAPLAAADFRNIFSFNLYSYGGIGRSTVYENSLVCPVSPKFSLLVKGYHDRRDDWDTTTVTLGSVYSFDARHYLETSYGYGRDSCGSRANYIAAELNRETALYCAGFGYRYSGYPGYATHVFSPSYRYHLSARSDLFGKFFISADSNRSYHYSFWGEGRYELFPRTDLTLGGTFGDRLHSEEYERTLSAETRFYSLIAGLAYRFSDAARVACSFEDLRRYGNISDTRSTLIVDVRF